MNRRKAGLIALFVIGIGMTGEIPLTFDRLAFGALQTSVSCTAVNFRSTTDSKFRKVAARFTVAGTGHRISLGDANFSGENFSAGTPAIIEDRAANMTYVSAIYVPKSLPTTDSPARSGSLSDITFTITIDGNKTDLPVKAPVIDVDPCATK